MRCGSRVSSSGVPCRAYDNAGKVNAAPSHFIPLCVYVFSCMRESLLLHWTRITFFCDRVSKYIYEGAIARIHS